MSEPVRQPTVFDSGQEHLGTQYARALLGAAARDGQAAAVVEELDAFIVEVLDLAPRLEAALASLRVPVAAKLGLLDKALAGRMSGTLLTFLKVVCRHRRFESLRAIRKAARQQLNESIGRVDVQVRTPMPLSDDVHELVTRRLESLLGKRVHLVVRLDASLIGGLVVRVGDTVYDASVARGLSRLRERALDEVARAVRESLDRFASPRSAAYTGSEA
jgi:F-type H+-transporting ATPase subunit delta